MKTYKITLTFLLFFQTILSANELSWVDTQVNAIKPPRIGISNNEILKTQDPFIYYKKTTQKKTSSKVKYSSIKKSSSNDTDAQQTSKLIKLSAIINNSALINGKWYKLNQNVEGFMISVITRTNVVLTKGSRKLVLTTNDQSKNIKFK